MLAVNPALTLAQLEAGLRQSSRPHVQAALLGNCSRPGNVGRCACTTASCGAGLLDVEQALVFAASPLNYSPPIRSVVDLADSRIQDCSTATGRSAGTTVVSTPTPVATETAATSGGGGGGAITPVWIVGLALAITVLAALRRERRNQNGAAENR
jgi:serine protease